MNQDNNQTNGEVSDRFTGSVALKLPDIAISNLVVSGDRIVFGNQFSVAWQVRNVSQSVASPNWNDRVLISRDNRVSPDDYVVGDFAAGTDVPLAIGASYLRNQVRTVPTINALTPSSYFLLGEFSHANALPTANSSPGSVSLTLPDGVIGTYYLILSADALNRVLEPNNESNNTASSIVSISLAPYADLVATLVSGPTQTIGDCSRRSLRVSPSWTLRRLNKI